jgi:hypothetical protein
VDVGVLDSTKEDFASTTQIREEYPWKLTTKRNLDKYQKSSVGVIGD